MAPQVLFIHNEHLATEGLLGEAFTECGYDVATFGVVPAERVDDPVLDVEFPDPSRYDVIVPLGARWPVYDEALQRTWVGAEMQMLRDAADAGVPTLGVCLGGQLLAQAFGGAVAPLAAPEIGWCEVASDDESLIPGGRWFAWHFDAWKLPPGATEIARTAKASQAFVLGRSVGLQFHPEVDHDMLARWFADDRNGEITGNGHTYDDLLSATRELQDSAALRIRALVRGFLTRFADQPCPS
jgi:GMP synthase-like glutamine amidotransferase